MSAVEWAGMVVAVFAVLGTVGSAIRYVAQTARTGGALESEMQGLREDVRVAAERSEREHAEVHAKLDQLSQEGRDGRSGIWDEVKEIGKDVALLKGRAVERDRRATEQDRGSR